MSEYVATVQWKQVGLSPDEQSFLKDEYSRGHEWIFDGGVVVPASASPHIVPLPKSVEANVDPEEAFVATVSSCHMLVFLSIAQKKRFVVEQYTDPAVGILAKNEEGKMAMTKITLRPQIVFSGDKQPTFAQLEKMHHLAHKECFIANSIKAEVVTEIQENP